MIDLKHLMLYDGKPWDFNRFNEPLVIDLQGLEYKQGGVPVIVKGKPDGHADITIAPIDKRDEIGLAIYADVHVEDGKLPENYTVGLDINIDDKYYMHPGTNLEINQDKWIVSSKGVWIAEPVTINAVYISEETTTTWLIDGWRNTVTQLEQKTEVTNMAITDEQYNAFKWDEPITNADLACEVLNEYVARCEHSLQYAKEHNMGFGCNIRKCTNGKWPKAYFRNNILMFGDENGFAIYYNGQSAINMMKEWNALQCGEVVFRGQKRGEAKMNYEQGLINNYDWNEPVSKHLEIAYEALQQCIVNNFSPFPTYNPKMTIARHRKTGRQPVAFINKDNESIGLGLAGGDGYWTDGSMSLKDLVNMWNKAQDAEEKHDDAITSEMVENYDWDAPITDPGLAKDVFNDCIRKQLELKKAKIKIARCARCGEYPVADIAINTFVLGCSKCKRVFWARKCDSLTAMVEDWHGEQQAIMAATANNRRQNEEPTEGQEHKETEMATTGEMIEKYDWNEPIANNRVLAADALEACIERNFPNQSQFDGAYMYGIPAKMEILRHKNSGEIPKVIKAEDGSNIGIGVDGFCYVWANPSDTLTTLVNKWNKLQGKDEKHDSDGKASVISPNDTNITIFIYKHGDTIEYYDKKYVIDTEHVKLDNIVFAKNPRVFSQPERVPITPYIKEGDIRVDIPAKTLNELDISNIHFSGVILKEHICEDKHIIDEFALLEVYYGAQSNYLFDRHEESAKETSLDVMGRNAFTLPQPAKTIDELEAEADRGLSKPEDVQKLKEANVLTGSQKAIAEVCDEIKELLLEKNRKYGNSALNPCRIFARSDRLEQIRVRIDDKLNRIKNEQSDEDEDVVKDLIGYLVLYTVAQLHDFNN